MKHILISLAMAFTMFMAGAVGVNAQQTPSNTVCNEKSGLQWDINGETDVLEYRVYVGNQADIEHANPPVQILVTVPHDPDSAILDADGNKIVKHDLNSLLSEGPKYFAVTAVDQVGNVSDYSNEIGCEYNVRPGAPVIQLIFTNTRS